MIEDSPAVIAAQQIILREAGTPTRLIPRPRSRRNLRAVDMPGPYDGRRGAALADIRRIGRDAA